MAGVDDIVNDLKQLRSEHQAQLADLRSEGSRIYRLEKGAQIDITAAFIRQEEEAIRKINDAISRFEGAREQRPAGQR